MAQYRGEKVRYRRRGLLRLRLRQLLEAQGLSAYGLAKFTGLSLNTIYRLTRPSGRFSLIRADTIERLGGALRVPPGERVEEKKLTASWAGPAQRMPWAECRTRRPGGSLLTVRIRIGGEERGHASAQS